MSKDTRVPVRMSSELKQAFEQAAASEGVSVSAWLRGLGEERIDELEFLPESANGNGALVAAFVPGA